MKKIIPEFEKLLNTPKITQKQREKQDNKMLLLVYISLKKLNIFRNKTSQ